MKYVAGLLFDQAGKNVLLMVKKKPEWQKARINAIGGKVEKGETSRQAMKRESCEEINQCPDWEMFMVLGGAGFEVAFFRAFDQDAYENAIEMEDEPIIRREVDNLPWGCIPNIHWIVPMALTIVRYENPEVFRVTEVSF